MTISRAVAVTVALALAGVCLACARDMFVYPFHILHMCGVDVVIERERESFYMCELWTILIVDVDIVVVVHLTNY